MLTVLAAPSPGAAEPLVVDDRGEEVRLETPADRVIALYGAFNEILCEMGAADRLVARTAADDHPPVMREKPSIGTHMRPNLELILAQKPDLVIQMAGRRTAGDILTRLEGLGVTTAMFRVESFADLYSVIGRLGALIGEPGAARDLINDMQTRLAEVDDRLQSIQDRPRVFYEVRYPNLLAAGRGSIVNEIIKRAGGVNVVQSDDKLVRLGEEALQVMAPQVYIIQEGPMNPDPAPVSKRPHFRRLPAVVNGRVHRVDEQAWSRPGPRNIAAVEELAAWLHPQRFADKGSMK